MRSTWYTKMLPAEILSLIPAVLRGTSREGTPLDAFVHAMSALHAPCEQALDRFAENLDPARASEPFLAYLAQWLDLSPAQACSTEHLRALLSAAAEVAKRRGTLSGLSLFLQVATGCQDVALAENVSGPESFARPFHLRVTAPAELRPHEALLRRIVEREKPAHVTYELLWQAQP